jgi:hypothetical protein
MRAFTIAFTVAFTVLLQLAARSSWNELLSFRRNAGSQELTAAARQA